MKMCKVLLLVFFVLLDLSCQNNRLKSNEKDLEKEIRKNEKEIERNEAERIAMENQYKDTLANIKTGFQYTEDRSVDQAHPPVEIDFSEEIQVKDFKLGNVATKINYIVLQVPDDSVYFLWGAHLSFTPNSIIINNNLGIHRFARDGKFLETICKNTFDAPRKIDPDKPFSGFFPKETFRGAWGNHVETAGNTVFYKYTDYPSEKVNLLKFSANGNARNLIAPATQETSLSETYSRGNVISSGKEAVRSGSEGLSSTIILPVSDNCFAGITSGINAFIKNSILLVTFNSKGDTLCKFKQFEFLKTPITSSVIRSFSNNTWHFGNTTTIKPAFNDTVFRLIPPNRLIPVFIFKFGDRKVTAEDWLHVNNKIDTKIRINGILENSNYLFIDYSYGPSGIKQISERAVFDKSKNVLFKFVTSEKSKDTKYKFWVNSLENNIDGGPDFWPSYVSPEGKLAYILRTQDLKRFIQNPEYATGTDPEKIAFKTFVQSLKDGGRESVIMITEK